MIGVKGLEDCFDRQPVTISFPKTASFSEVYGFVGKSGRVFLEGQLLRRDTESSRYKG